MELMLIGVEGAFTEALQLESPEALAAITSPVTVSGQSTAFEAVVNVEIREDGTIDPLVETTVMGGSMGQLGPFSRDQLRQGTPMAGIYPRLASLVPGKMPGPGHR